jgi:thioredoxin reductase
MLEKDLIIIGSGPAGLRAGEEAAALGLDYLILEKGEIADAWKRIRPNMPMLSPNHPQRDWTSISPNFPIWKLDVKRPYCSAAEFVFYLEEYCHHYNLNIKTQVDITDIKKDSDGFFILSSKSGQFKSRVLLNTSGFFGNPYIPNIPGFRNSPIVSHSHDYKSDEPFRSKRVVIIGGGNSGAELAIDLVGYSQVYLVTRGKLEFFSKTKNLCDIRGISESLLLELIAMELIRFIPNADIKRLEGNKLYYNQNSLETQHIICATGYRPVVSHLDNLKINVHKKTKFPIVENTGVAEGVENLYFAGPLGYNGLRSLFIHGFIRNIPATIADIKLRIEQHSPQSLKTVVS